MMVVMAFYDGGDGSKSVEAEREKNWFHHAQLQLLQQCEQRGRA